MPPNPTPLLDAAHRLAYRIAFPLAVLWWHLRRPRHEGAMIGVHVGPKLLLLRTSYRLAWCLPGGGLHSNESPERAARRELAEETGITTDALLPHGTACGIWDGQRDQVHFFQLHLDSLPELRLDNREIIAARLVSPEEARRMRLTGPTLAYLRGSASPK